MAVDIADTNRFCEGDIIRDHYGDKFRVMKYGAPNYCLIENITGDRYSGWVRDDSTMILDGEKTYHWHLVRSRYEYQ
ncbi:MAG: hypothetical protein ACO3EZ_15080 [Prochlorotrichaceae cyanobacterium]